MVAGVRAIDLYGEPGRCPDSGRSQGRMTDAAYHGEKR